MTKLKRYNSKDKLNVKYISATLIVLMIIIIVFVISKSHALYRELKEYDVIKTQIGDFKGQIINKNYYVNDELVSNAPQLNTYDIVNAECDNATVNINYEIQDIEISNPTQRVVNCNIYYGPIKWVLSYDENNDEIANIGDIIRYGTEYFYVYSNDTNTIKALSKYNLEVGNECESKSSSSCIELENPSNMQDKNSKGYISEQNLYRKGTTNFSDNINKGDSYSDYENSNVYKYVNTYKTNLINIGTQINNARLITKEEIEFLAKNNYEIQNSSERIDISSTIPQWLHSSSYWTMTKYDDTKIWVLNTLGSLYASTYGDSTAIGVRPVIELNTSLISEQTKVPSIYNFEYEGEKQTFETLIAGTYKIELWGAQGAIKNSIIGGQGAYVSGIIELNPNQKLYVYVGSQGIIEKIKSENAADFVFNGGAAGNFQCDKAFSDGGHNMTGGGATDIRLTEGNWDNQTSLASRIMVAGAGGGTANYGDDFGGAGGGLEGYDAIGKEDYIGKKGTQTTGGQLNGAFGKGGKALYNGNGCNYDAGTGGGSGYYGGGGSSTLGGRNYADGGGGSSYISGHTGCVAIKSVSDITPKSGCSDGTTNNDCSIHYSNVKFINTLMIDGNGYYWTYEKKQQKQMPNPAGGYYDLGTGHIGDGYARITLISI